MYRILVKDVIKTETNTSRMHQKSFDPLFLQPGINCSKLQV